MKKFTLVETKSLTNRTDTLYVFDEDPNTFLKVINYDKTSINIQFLKSENGLVKHDFKGMPASIWIDIDCEDRYTDRISRFENGKCHSDIDFSSVGIFHDSQSSFAICTFDNESKLYGCKTNEEIQLKRSLILADEIRDLNRMNKEIAITLSELNKDFLKLDDKDLNFLYEICSIKDFNYDFKVHMLK